MPVLVPAMIGVVGATFIPLALFVSVTIFAQHGLAIYPDAQFTIFVLCDLCFALLVPYMNAAIALSLAYFAHRAAIKG